MEIQQTILNGVLLIKPVVHGDNRGYFFESFQNDRYQKVGIMNHFVQDNISLSSKGTLRGLHYQLKKPQAKLLSVITGSIYDVAVDIRINSPTFGKHFGTILSEENHYQLFIPEGFAHGFYVLSESAHIQYKCSQLYFPNDEHGIMWNDPSLNINWPINNSTPLLSPKDSLNKKLAEIKPEFLFND